MKQLRNLWAAILSVILIAIFAACGAPQMQPVDALTDSTQTTTETLSTTLPSTTITVPQTAATPSKKKTSKKYSLDLSDQASAVNSLRELFFENKELFNSIKDGLWAMEEYDWAYSSGEDGSDCVIINYENGGYSLPAPETIESGLHEKLKQYFALLETPIGRSVRLAHWGGSKSNYPNRDRVVAFEYGFLEKPNIFIVGITYSPNFRNSFVERLEGNWYLDFALATND